MRLPQISANDEATVLTNLRFSDQVDQMVSLSLENLSDGWEGSNSREPYL